MAEYKVGQEVTAQARDNSLMNTEPVMARSAIVGIISAVLAILVIGGYITGDEKGAIEEQAGVIIPAAILLLQLLSGIWARMAAYSPRSAAKIAVVNASATTGSAPTLDPPP